MIKNLTMRVMDFKGDDEMATPAMQVCEPTFYDDGTAEVKIELYGNRSAYVRFALGDLVGLRARAPKAEEAPEAK